MDLNWKLISMLNKVFTEEYSGLIIAGDQDPRNLPIDKQVEIIIKELKFYKEVYETCPRE